MGIEKIKGIKTIKELFAYMEEEKGSFPGARITMVVSANFKEGIKTRFLDRKEIAELRKNGRFVVVKVGKVWEISEKPKIQIIETPVNILAKEKIIRIAV